MAIAEGDSSAAARIGDERVALQQSIIDSQVEFVLNNPASYATPVVMRSMIVSLDAGELRDLVQKLDANLLRTDIIKSLTGTIEKMEKLSPGNPAPEFTQTDNDGNIVSLSQFIGEGPVLIYFWASWCSACRSINPTLVKLSENYSVKGLKIIAISLDSSKDDWDNAITEDNLDWIHLSDLEFWNNEVAVLYNINEIPSGYLIDSKGIIIGNSIDNTRLEELLSMSRGE
jgi:thiol-disulfide isomerase/thioredoxin